MITITAKVKNSAARKEPPALSGEDVFKVLELLKGSTSVELKLSVPDSSRRAVVERLGFDPVEAEPRQIYFFDTPDLALNKAGVIVRARRSPGGRGDTVVKLRPVDPAKLDPELRRSEGFKIELDAMPGGYVCSASYRGLCKSREVLDVAGGTLPLMSLFSKEQRDFYNVRAPKEIPMESLVTLGPTFMLRLKYTPENFDRRVTVELWLYPDGSRIFEISTKSLPEEGFQLAAEFKSYLSQHGIALSADQLPKTNSALNFFSKKYAAEHAG